MTSIAKTPIQGRVIRVTLIDDCGAPVPGPCGYAVSKCFTQVSMSDNVEDGTEFKSQAADGTFCVNQRSSPQLNWIEVGVTLNRVDPELVSLLTGSPVVYDGNGVAVGFQTTVSAYATASFALEVWTNTARDPDASVCAGGTVNYGYLLLPWLVEGSLGDTTIESGVATLTLNAITSSGTDWGHGPWDVVKTALGAASPLLSPLDIDVHRHLQWTELAPPAVTSGCAFLDPVS